MTSDQRHDFFSLPNHIRHRIYDILLRDKRAVQPLRSNTIRKYFHRLDGPAVRRDAGFKLLLTCKHISKECRRVLYGDNTYLLASNDIKAVLGFLKRIGPYNRSLIRSLEIDFECLPKQSDQDPLKNFDTVDDYMREHEFEDVLGDSPFEKATSPCGSMQPTMRDIVMSHGPAHVFQAVIPPYKRNPGYLKYCTPAIWDCESWWWDLFNEFPTPGSIRSSYFVDLGGRLEEDLLLLKRVVEFVGTMKRLLDLEIWFPDSQRSPLGYLISEGRQDLMKPLQQITALSTLCVHGVEHLHTVEQALSQDRPAKVMIELNRSLARPFLTVSAGRLHLPHLYPRWTCISASRELMRFKLRADHRTQRDRFSSLPAEIRSLIYEYCVIDWIGPTNFEETIWKDFEVYEWEPGDNLHDAVHFPGRLSAATVEFVEYEIIKDSGLMKINASYPLHRVPIIDLHPSKDSRYFEKRSAYGIFGLLTTSRMIYHEIAPMLYSSVCFDIPSPEYSDQYPDDDIRGACPMSRATDFLRSFSASTIKYLRHLSLMMRVFVPRLNEWPDVTEPGEDVNYQLSLRQRHSTGPKIASLAWQLRGIPDLHSLRLDFTIPTGRCSSWERIGYPGTYLLDFPKCMHFMSTVKVRSLEIIGRVHPWEAETLARRMGAQRVGLDLGHSKVRIREKGWTKYGGWAMKLLRADNNHDPDIGPDCWRIVHDLSYSKAWLEGNFKEPEKSSSERRPFQAGGTTQLTAYEAAQLDTW